MRAIIHFRPRPHPRPRPRPRACPSAKVTHSWIHFPADVPISNSGSVNCIRMVEQ